MPFELQPGETVLFPAPFVPNEPQKLVISTKRVAQYAAAGMYPIAEFPVEKIEHVGRLSEYPTRVLGILLAIFGLVLFIVSVAKVLPQALYAGAPPSAEAGDGSGDTPEEGIEGRDANDDDPFDDGKEKKEKLSDKASKKLKKMKEIKFGWPGFTEDVIVGILCLLGSGVALLLGRFLYKKERHLVFCRIGQIVYPIEVADSTQQNAVLSMIQAAQQSNPKK